MASAATGISLIVGLGNPGPRYTGTRHNAGADFVEALAKRHSAFPLKAETRFHGLLARIDVAGRDLRLLIPTTFMNRSGQSVSAVASYFDIAPQNILVAHDELDLPVGSARLKTDGGHGGHNGLRDIVKALGSSAFLRLRIGIGHPGDASRVVDYVLHLPSLSEQSAIAACIDESIATLPLLLGGDMARAMTRLHSFRAS